MRKVCLVHAVSMVAAAAFLCSPACAQQAPASTYNWSGWHAGGFAGWMRLGNIEQPAASYYQNLGTGVVFDAGSTSEGSSGTHNGIALGGTLGYRHQFNWLVLGVDADLQYADIRYDRRANTNFSFNPIAAGLPAFGPFSAGGQDPREGDNDRWMAMARLRAGVALDRWLVFVSGGAAYRFANPETDPYLVDHLGEVSTQRGYATADRWGWVLGGGFEYALTNAITTKFEYLHADFGSASYLDPIATYVASAPVLHRYDSTANMVRAGLSFRFSTPGN